jgi:peptidoglycan/LPS O-acetylase OafA/YrhL
VGAIALLFALALLLLAASFTYRFVEEPARHFGRAWLDRARPVVRESAAGATRESHSEPSVVSPISGSR